MWGAIHLTSGGLLRTQFLVCRGTFRSTPASSPWLSAFTPYARASRFVPLVLLDCIELTDLYLHRMGLPDDYLQKSEYIPLTLLRRLLRLLR